MGAVAVIRGGIATKLNYTCQNKKKKKSQMNGSCFHHWSLQHIVIFFFAYVPLRIHSAFIIVFEQYVPFVFQLQHQIHQQSVRNYAQLHMTRSQFTGHQTMSSLLYHMNSSTPSSPVNLMLSVSLYAALWWEYNVCRGIHENDGGILKGFH